MFLQYEERFLSTILIDKPPFTFGVLPREKTGFKFKLIKYTRNTVPNNSLQITKYASPYHNSRYHFILNFRVVFVLCWLFFKSYIFINRHHFKINKN